MKRWMASGVVLACALALSGCGGGGGGNAISADGSSTVGPLVTKAAEDFRKENEDVDITVGISGTGGGFERFCRGETDLSNASRPIKDEEKDICEQERRRLRRAPGCQRRPHGGRQPGERLGEMPHRRRAEADLGAGFQGRQLERGPRRVSRRAAQALRPGHRLGHVRLLHRRDRRRGGRQPLRLFRQRGRQRHHPGSLGREGRPRLPRLLVLRGEPGVAECGRDRRGQGLRRAQRRHRAEWRLRPARASAVRLREEERPRPVGGRRLPPLSARQPAGDRRGGSVRPHERRTARPGEERSRGEQYVRNRAAAAPSSLEKATPQGAIYVGQLPGEARASNGWAAPSQNRIAVASTFARRCDPRGPQSPTAVLARNVV